MFLLVNNKEIKKIFEINNSRYFLKNNNAIALKCRAPKIAVGWIKEYWRTKAQISLINKKIIIASNCYFKALEASPDNPYLLKEFINFCYKYKVESVNISLLEKKYQMAVRNMVKFNKQAIIFWQKKVIYYLYHQNFELYLYYLGSIFWREQSIKLLENKKPNDIKTILINNNNLPIYRLSPAWFKKTGNGLLISKTIINNKNIVFKAEFTINSFNKNFYRKFLKVKINKGYIFIVNNKFTLNNSVVYNNVLAHRQLLGLLKPELIVV
jgi:hypothetical protein